MPRSTHPEPGRRSAVRRSQRVRDATRRVVAPAAGGGSAAGLLTTRAAVLGLVLCALVVSAALPLREFLSQRARISALEQSQAAQQVRVDGLEDQRRLLADPAYVASLARERLHYERPGETTYVVLAPDTAPESPAPGVVLGESPKDAPWYSQLWSSVREADSPPPP